MRKIPPHTWFFGAFFTAYGIFCAYTLLRFDLLLSVAGRMAICWLAALAVMLGLFVVAARRGRYDYVDIGWGLSFIAIALAGYGVNLVEGTITPIRTIVLLLVVVWGIRLSAHIGTRLRRSTQEDPRYVELRSRWKQVTKWAIFVHIYVVQSILALLVSIPIVHIQLIDHTPWSIWTSIGVLVWLFGFAWEGIGDRQLGAFIRRPENRGQLLQTGLWAYTRHPNYFGEITMWWGIACISLGTPYGWVGAGGAALITYLITFVSGVPLAEKRSSTKPGWKAYSQKTPKLIPFIR